MIEQNIKIEKNNYQVNGTYSKSILIYKFPRYAVPGFLYGLSHGAHVGVNLKNGADTKTLEAASKKRVDVNLSWHFKEATFQNGLLSREAIKWKLKRIERKIASQNTGRAADVVDKGLIESRDAWRDILEGEQENDYLEVHFLMTFTSDDHKALKDSVSMFKQLLRKDKNKFKYKELKRQQGKAMRAAWLLGTPEHITKKYPGQIVNQDQLAAFYPYLDGSFSRPEKGVYIGHRSGNGTTVHVDFTLGSDGQNILVIGKTGKGKSYWIKGLMEGLREAGFKVYYSDPDGESKEKIEAMGGLYLDLTTNMSIFVDPTIIVPALMDEIDKKAYSKTDLKRIEESDAYRYQLAMDETLNTVSSLCDAWNKSLSNATEFAFMMMYKVQGIKEGDQTTWNKTQDNPNVSLKKMYDVVKSHAEGKPIGEYTLKKHFIEASQKLEEELWTYFEGGNRHVFDHSIDYREYAKYQVIGYKIATDLTEASPEHVKKMARIRLSMISTLNLRLIQRDRLLKLNFSAEIFDEFQRSGKAKDTQAVAYRAMTTSRKYNSMAIIGLNDPTVLEDGIWGNTSHKVLFYTEENLINNSIENIKIEPEVVSKWRNLGQYEFIYMQSDPETNIEQYDVCKMYLPEEESELAATRGVAS